MYQVYIGSADNTSRPYSLDDQLNTQPLDGWELIAQGKTAEEALEELIEAANSEDISIENSWLRLVTTPTIEQRLEYLRGELQAERISTSEIIELQSLAQYIDPSDVELLEAAGVPEFEEVDE